MKIEKVYKRFRSDFINSLSEELSKLYKNVSFERIKVIAEGRYELWIETLIDKVRNVSYIDAHEKALEKTFEYYYSSVFYEDLYERKRTLEEKYGRQLTNQEISHLKEDIATEVFLNPERIFIYPEVYAFYFKAMYKELEDLCEFVALEVESIVSKLSNEFFNPDFKIA